VVETALVQFAVQKPQPEERVAELLAEESFAAHAEQGGEQARLEQLLRRNAGASLVGVECVEPRRELGPHGVHAPLDAAQRVLRRHPVVEVDDGEEFRLAVWIAAHVFSDSATHARIQKNSEFFNNLLGRWVACATVRKHAPSARSIEIRTRGTG